MMLSIFVRAYALPFCLACLLLGAYAAILFRPENATIFYISVFCLALAIVASIFAFHVNKGFMLTAFVRASLCVTVGALIIVFAYSWVEHRLNERISSQLPSSLESQDLFIAGRVLKHVGSDKHFKRFLFDVERLSLSQNGLKQDFSGRVRLSFRSQAPVRIGDYLHFQVRLKRPRGFVNPNGFDYQYWLLSQSIVATGYVKTELGLSEAERAVLALKPAFPNVRGRVIKALESKINDLDQAALIKALLVGDKSDITLAQWGLFQQTGTIHLMAISGLHIGMVAGIALYLISLITKPLSLWFGSNLLANASYLLCTVVAFFYAYLAGFSVPTQRAFFCIMVFGLALRLGRKTSFMHVLLIIAVGIVITEPMLLVSPGFVLSFSAVACLVLGLGRRVGKRSIISTLILAQVLVWFALAPILLALDLPVSISSPLANFLAVPLISVVILPVLLFGLAIMPLSSSASIAVFELANITLIWLERALHTLATPPVFFSDPPMSLIVLMLFAAGLFIAPAAFKLRAYSLVLLSFCGVMLFRGIDEQGIKMTVLDVGQGLSVVVENKHSRMIYDVGAKFSDSFSIASRVLYPFLQSQGSRRNTLLVLSHGDNDHAGDAANFHRSLLTLSDQAPTVLSGEPDKIDIAEVEPCYDESISPLASLFNERSNIEPSWFSARHDLPLVAKIEVLWPPSHSQDAVNAASFGKSNNTSCVLLLTIQGAQILLMGDVEHEVERELLRMDVLPSAIDLLIAPHHGSNTSSHAALVARLAPRHVIMSAGYKNRYRPPASAVVERYQRAGSELWYTAHHGAITAQFNAEGFTIRGERCANSRQWYLDEGYCATQASSQGKMFMYDYAARLRELANNK